MDIDKKKDIEYSIAKAGIGSLPIIGAAASEILQLLVTPPLEKRRTEWMENIGERIKQLENETIIDLTSLQNNDIFIDVVLQITNQALKTSEKEKLDYYRNAILNTALGEHPELSEMQIFLNLISDFTVWHIKILKLIDFPTDWFVQNAKSIPDYSSVDLSNIIEMVYPDLIGRQEFYTLIWEDLKRAGLIQSSRLLHHLYTNSSSATSPFGEKFLRFISEVHPCCRAIASRGDNNCS